MRGPDIVVKLDSWVRFGRTGSKKIKNVLSSEGGDSSQMKAYTSFAGVGQYS